MLLFHCRHGYGLPTLIVFLALACLVKPIDRTFFRACRIMVIIKYVFHGFLQGCRGGALRREGLKGCHRLACCRSSVLTLMQIGDRYGRGSLEEHRCGPFLISYHGEQLMRHDCLT